MATISSTHVRKLKKLCTDLEARYGEFQPLPIENFIEIMMYQILLLGADRAEAERALKDLQEEFVNWNDMRVSTVREIQDILGNNYPRNREKAEDINHLLADLYTAFKSMELDERAITEEGIETLRALPETTLVREDMVESALLHNYNLVTFPCNEEQYALLEFLKVIPAGEDNGEIRYRIADELDRETKLRLAHGLREHSNMLEQAGEYDPQPLNFGLKKKAAAKKAAAKKTTTKKAAAKKPAAKKAATTKKAAAKKAASKKK